MLWQRRIETLKLVDIIASIRRFIASRSSEISEVIAPMKNPDKEWCDMVMKNGS